MTCTAPGCSGLRVPGRIGGIKAGGARSGICWLAGCAGSPLLLAVARLFPTVSKAGWGHGWWRHEGFGLFLVAVLLTPSCVSWWLGGAGDTCSWWGSSWRCPAAGSATALACIGQEMRVAQTSPRAPALCNCAAADEPEKGEPAPAFPQPLPAPAPSRHRPGPRLQGAVLLPPACTTLGPGHAEGFGGELMPGNAGGCWV